MMDDIKRALSDAVMRADCSRRSVGALIVQEGKVVGVGWNSLPAGSCIAGECPRGRLTYAEQPAFVGYGRSGCVATHAEDLALQGAGLRAVGSTCYVTCEPCPGCADLLSAAGVSEIVVIPLDSILSFTRAHH